MLSTLTKATVIADQNGWHIVDNVHLVAGTYFVTWSDGRSRVSADFDTVGHCTHLIHYFDVSYPGVTIRHDRTDTLLSILANRRKS